MCWELCSLLGELGVKLEEEERGFKVGGWCALSECWLIIRGLCVSRGAS